MGKESKEDHSLRNGIIAGIISAITLPMLGWLFGVLGIAIRALVAVWRFFISSTALPRWLIGLLLIASFSSLYKILRAVIRKKTSETSVFSGESSKLDFHTYTRDVFDGFNGTVWRWRYMSSDNSIWDVNAFCPRC